MALWDLLRVVAVIGGVAAGVTYSMSAGQATPGDPRYEWVGFNLLCTAAPTPFILDQLLDY